MQRLDPRRTLAALALSMTLAACGTAATPAAPTMPPPPASPLATPSAPETPAADGSAWAPAGAMALARASTHAAVLGDGRVLVVGNDNLCEPGGAWEDSVLAELYDPATGTWAPAGSLNAPRTDFAAVTLPDGRVLVAGGMTSADPAEGAFGAYSSAKLFDPAKGTWSSTGLMGTARTEPAAALLPDGTVLVAGGAYVDSDGNRDLASAEIYDPETGTWSPTGDMSTARRGARAVTLADGRVLVVGASHGSLASAEIYDPAAGAWSPAGSLAQARDDFALVALPDGGALVAGGAVEGSDIQQATATAERLDPATLRWSPAADMSTAAANRSAVLLGDGRVLVAGGVTITDARATGGSTERPPLADAELYDPTTDRWAPAPSLPTAREGGTFVTLADRTVLLVGGDLGYVGEPMMPWCPPPVAEAVRYVPGNLALFPAVKPPVAATLAKSSVAAGHGRSRPTRRRRPRRSPPSASTSTGACSPTARSTRRRTPSSRRRASPSRSGWPAPARTARPRPRWTPSSTSAGWEALGSGSTPSSRRSPRATRRGRT